MLFKKNPAFLHVGNIAHNAYYNARSLKKLSCDSDILVNDYYHYAACPEWLGLGESGVTKKSLGSDYFPNFFKFSEAKKLRPESYIQGPTHLALAYIWFRRQKKREQAQRMWSILQFQRMKVVATRNPMAWQKIWNKTQFNDALDKLEVHSCYMEQLIQGFEEEQKSKVFLSFLEKVVGAKLTPTSLPLANDYLDDLHHSLSQNDRLHEASKLEAFRENFDTVTIGVEHIPSEFKINKEMFVNFSEEDVHSWEPQLSSWHEIFNLYDRCIAYGTNTIFAMLTRCPNYLAYEHGTLRTVPFENSALGRLTAESYRQAKVVFVTNADFVKAEPKLSLKPSQVIYIPHGFDRSESKLFLKANKNVTPPTDTVLFIAPARHTWKTPSDGNSKGNDRIVKAIAILAAKGVSDFTVDFIEYGEDTIDTKNLIDDLGVGSYINWLPSQTRPQLWRRYLSSHAVLDQFIIPAIGAIGVESLALGRRLINADDGSLGIFFNSNIPLLGACTDEEIAEKMLQVIEDPTDKKKIGEQSKKWFANYHDEKHIRKQLKAALSR